MTSTSRQSKHRKKRRIDGRCVVEGCEAVSGDKFRCDQHAEAHRVAARVRYWVRKGRASVAA